MQTNRLSHSRILRKPILVRDQLTLGSRLTTRRAAPGHGNALPTQFSGIALPQLDAIDLQNAKESLQQSSGVAQQYAGQAAGLLSGVWSSLLQPFAVFGDAWILNVLFFATIILLTYSLLVLAPRQ